MAEAIQAPTVALARIDIVIVLMYVGGIALMVLSMWEAGGPIGVREKIAQLRPRVIVTLRHEELISEDAEGDAMTGAGFKVLRSNGSLLETTPIGFLYA